ncbi:MAG: DUF924 domain-containing protein [Gammaproteobacteria bacterium]|nr:DUF924 domain-containing protein [Gammaproteobacteria bacterium]MDH5345814.1 DUF924 domain-containing protein [Gammaproteobacteria bacterium]
MTEEHAGEAALSAEDQSRIDAILTFWFKEHALSAPQIDGRMDVWFGEDPLFDEEIASLFSRDVDEASVGNLDHWSSAPRGRLALILLLDQFRRNIYRNTPAAFEMDRAALKLCVEGAMEKKDMDLSPIERVFFYMPLQHAESRKVQQKSREIYGKLSEAVSPTFRETFETVAQFAELHADIVEQFGRFPHRNRIMGRENTPEEAQYLAGDAPTFGQGES